MAFVSWGLLEIAPARPFCAAAFNWWPTRLSVLSAALLPVMTAAAVGNFVGGEVGYQRKRPKRRFRWT
jgi:hypothetical protein